MSFGSYPFLLAPRAAPGGIWDEPGMLSSTSVPQRAFHANRQGTEGNKKGETLSSPKYLHAVQGVLHGEQSNTERHKTRETKDVK